MRPHQRRTVTGEILGRWLIAIALAPIGFLLITLAGGHVTGGLLIALIVVMVLLALVRAGRGRR